MVIKMQNSLDYFDPDSAVSYRIPQPIREIHRYRRGESFPICPRCAIPLEREYQAYCDRCGQALDWADYNRALVVII